MSPKRVFVTGLFALALPGCDPFEATIQVPEVCQDLDAIEIRGVPGSSATALEESFEIDLVSALAKAGIDLAGSGEIDLSRLSIWPVSGIDDFGFVDEAEIAIEGQNAAAPHAVVARHARSTGAPAATRIDTQPDSALDLVPYVTSGAVRVTASFTGDAPDKGWAFSGEVCVRVKAKFSPFSF